MALGVFVAGRYSATVGGQAVGLTKNGFELEMETKNEVIDETDAYGATILDYIERGINWSIQWTAREYGAAPLTPLLPFAALGQLVTASNPIGRLASDMASALVLTSTAGTPAASAPATLTATKAILHEAYNGRILFDSRLRELPVRMRLLPYPSTPSTTIIHFATT